MNMHELAADVLEKAAESAPAATAIAATAIAPVLSPAASAVAEAAGIGVKAVLLALAEAIRSKRKTIEQVLAEIKMPPREVDVSWLDAEIADERAKGHAT